MSKFYRFRQNNSGGVFDIDDQRGIGPIVFIEADNALEADDRAENKGIYFDGVENEQDCECCGDRWSTTGDGSYYNNTELTHYDFAWHNTVYVHKLDGTILRIKEQGDFNV